MLRLSFDDTKRAYGQFWFDFLALIMAVGFASILQPLNILGIASYFKNETASIAAYVLLVLAFIFPAIWMFNFAARIREIENPLLEELAHFRTTGVDLRNKLQNSKTEPELLGLIQEYQKWDGDMLSVLGKISRGKAAWLATLDKMPWVLHGNAISGEHDRYLNILNEKLVRLNSILMSYLNIPGSTPAP